ncbi:MAG: phosphate signaling complex protein PhoU [Chlorobi bacterium]|nr:phosphate signaling complex protein PhoU [Chlorobiota bacterium]
MTLHFQREVDKLKRMILNEAAMVENGLQKALKALRERDEELALEIKKSDSEIDAMEIEIEEEALKILALHQPVAIDLRFIISVIKINSDLERIGDLTANIAARTIDLVKFPRLPIPENLSRMAEVALVMVKESLDSLVNLDVELALKVCDDDEKVDDLHKETFALVRNKVKVEPENIDFFLMIMGISRYLERIADHSTNIAEDVMYMVEGKISRHQQN